MKTYSNDDSTIIVYAEDSNAVMYSTSTIGTPKKPVDDEAAEANTDKVAAWGDSNDFPQLIIKELEKNSDLASIIDLQARVLYAGGVKYRVIDNATGEEVKVNKPDIDAFLKRNWMYPIKAVGEFYKFINVFPQFIISAGDKIKWLTCHDSKDCRYSMQNSSGIVQWCYVSANWPNTTYNKKTTSKVKVIDPVTCDAEDLKEADKKKTTYIYPLSYPTGKSYYQLAIWNALRHNGWLELANEIPKFKIKLMKNQLTIKYHIEIPDHYWSFKFPKWDTFTPEQKKEAREKEIAAINAFLKGSDNAGKSITTPYHFDKVTMKEYPGIKIHAIDDKLKDGAYLEDSVEATIKIFTALGIDPSILGIVPGKGGSNRSGSDKREALNIYISIIQPHADILLRPYDFASDYNGWNTKEQKIEFYFNAPLLQTLDQVSPDKRETTPNNEPDAT